ncbi:hypothetical protein MIND_00149100 [Mycena indigotica]|uniref:Uncharacterized protein n=1 Tax=Mycena indigotica TaxID=2126181 RepID=A0A8H6WF19_9AGAR|nr:uncharacterized protein MIND_00149100 [Mycena indigotica]KAF7316304.1 hypothetical protein MIND_00149100 [Mycena indigotica]
MPVGSRMSLLYLLLALAWNMRCSAILVNITIDDMDTAWSWNGAWNAVTPESPCPNHLCVVHPDSNQAYNHSWHNGALFSGTFTFKGVAVYIYGIDIVNPANVSFSMECPRVSTFHYVNTNASGNYVYNSLFFSASNLDGTKESTVLFQEMLAPMPSPLNPGRIALLDYAVVTIDLQTAAPPNLPQQPEPSNSIAAPQSSTSNSTTLSTGDQQSESYNSNATTSSTPGGPTPRASHPGASNQSRLLPVIGGILGAVGAMALAGIMILCSARRRHRNVNRNHSPAPETRTQSNRLAVRFKLIFERLRRGIGASVRTRATPYAFSLETEARPQAPAGLGSRKNPPTVAVQNHDGNLSPDPAPALAPAPQRAGSQILAPNRVRAARADSEVERRLRVLEELVRAYVPPAYTQPPRS